MNAKAIFLKIVSIFLLDVILNSLRVDFVCLCHIIIHKISKNIEFQLYIILLILVKVPE